MKPFWKKKAISVDVAEFSSTHVGPDMVATYITNLYKKEKFLHIGYRLEESEHGFLRYVLYTLPTSKIVIQYFKDRCPAMIEKECMECKSVEPYTWSIWPNGFEEIVFSDAD